MTGRSGDRGKAISMLVLATAAWGVSYPVMKALFMMQEGLAPRVSSWFLASAAISLRFAGAALLLVAWNRRWLRSAGWLEIRQGTGLALWGGLGLLFQMDGLNYTSVSVSAFLTQTYCLLLPILAALRTRSWPSMRVLFCCALVLVGVAILARLEWRALRLGRGELETLAASGFFAGQILWLERPVFAGNRSGPVTLVMCSVCAVLFLPIVWWRRPSGEAMLAAFGTAPVWSLYLVLISACTLGAYWLMNVWQPKVDAVEAGLIYCAEPVLASIFALFLPAWLSRLGHVPYANELMSWRLACGGGLILLANVLLQLPVWPRRRPAEGIPMPPLSTAPPSPRK